MSSSTDRPRVLLVNPNTNAGTTEMMRLLAVDELPDHDVVAVTAAQGPRMIVDPESLAESADHVVRAVRAAWRPGTSAVVVAAIGDPGREELAATLDVPVVGIGQASVLSAARGGRPYAMATSTPRLVGSLTALAALHGGRARFTGVRLTPSEPLALAAEPERQHRELADAVAGCVADGAEAVIIAGGPLSATARRLSRDSPVRIVEPVPSACALVRERIAATVARRGAEEDHGS